MVPHVGFSITRAARRNDIDEPAKFVPGSPPGTSLTTRAAQALDTYEPTSSPGEASGTASGGVAGGGGFPPYERCTLHREVPISYSDKAVSSPTTSGQSNAAVSAAAVNAGHPQAERRSDFSETAFENETRMHQQEVSRLLLFFAQELLDRAKCHDESKLQAPEREIFARATPLLRGLTYGSAEYKASLASMGPALEHHYAVNRHHPEFHDSRIYGMNLVDVVEMFCDWVAATKRHADGDVDRSLTINKKRFNMDCQLVSILRNTAKALEDM